MTKSVHGNYGVLWEGMTEEKGLRTFSEKQSVMAQTRRFAPAFHSRKSLISPMFERRVRRTTSDDDEAEQRR